MILIEIIEPHSNTAILTRMHSYLHAYTPMLHATPFFMLQVVCWDRIKLYRTIGYIYSLLFGIIMYFALELYSDCRALFISLTQQYELPMIESTCDVLNS